MVMDTKLRRIWEDSMNNPVSSHVQMEPVLIILPSGSGVFQ